MLSGLPEIDFDDWRTNTEYSGCDEQDTIVKVSNAYLVSYFDEMRL